MFQLTDIPRILPEILLIVLAVLVLGSDIFERWANTAEAQRARARAAGSLTATGLALIFAITLLQSGYVPIPSQTPIGFLNNIILNLQSGGPIGDPIVGVFATDHLTMIARLLFIAAAFLTTLLAFDFRPSRSPGEFYALILASTTGMCLMAAASELITAYLAVELTSIPLYILAGYFRDDPHSSEAGMKYFLFGALSSGILLYGMSLAYGFTANAFSGSVAANNLTLFAQIAQAGQASTGSSLLTLSMIFVIAGVGYKVALVPFHSWSPDVYQGAPTPITAFISTASKAAGFVLLYRLLVVAFPSLAGTAVLGAELGGWTSLLAFVAVLTLVVGNLAALPQTNAKRLLAYSSIAQAGFLVMALVAWASPLQLDRALGSSALLYYLVVYTVTNLGAFGALAVVSMATGGDDISDLNGLAQRNLPLATLFALCVLSLAGIPPLAGFFAKFYVFMAAWQTKAYWLVIIAVISTIVSLYYYLRLLKAMFMTAPNTDAPVPAPPAMQATLVIAVALLLLLGIAPGVVLSVLNQVQVAAGG